MRASGPFPPHRTVETHSCMNVTLCLNMTAGGDAARKAQDRPVRGDTSRVGDVTGRTKRLMESQLRALLDNCPAASFIYAPIASSSSAVRPAAAHQLFRFTKFLAKFNPAAWGRSQRSTDAPPEQRGLLGFKDASCSGVSSTFLHRHLRASAGFPEEPLDKHSA